MTNVLIQKSRRARWPSNESLSSLRIDRISQTYIQPQARLPKQNCENCVSGEGNSFLRRVEWIEF